MILHDEYTKQCREETVTDRGQAIRKKKDLRFTVWKMDEVTKGGDPVEHILAGLSFGSQVKEQMQPPQSLICPTPAPALGLGVWCDVWSCLRKAMIKKGRNEAMTSASGGSGGSRRSTDWHTRVVCTMDCSLCKRGTCLGTKTLKLSESPCWCLSTNPLLPQWLSVFISLYLSPVVSLSLSLGCVFYRLWRIQVR